MSVPVMGNRQGQVTEPKGDHFSSCNLGMLPKNPGIPFLWLLGRNVLSEMEMISGIFYVNIFLKRD